MFVTWALTQPARSVLEILEAEEKRKIVASLFSADKIVVFAKNAI